MVLLLFALAFVNQLYNVVNSDLCLLNEFGLFSNKTQYRGEKFNATYLMPEKVPPTMSDVNYYLKKIKLVVDFFNNSPNATDCNVALGMFFMKALLKRTLIDDGSKLDKGFYRNMKELVDKAENMVSHFITINKQYDWNDLRLRFSKLLKSDEAQVYSVKTFHKSTIKRWIHSNIKLNDFIEEMDIATYPKENYVELVATADRYFKVFESDECLSRISFNPEPISMELKRCRPDTFCEKRVFAAPSVSYALSHRLLNLMGLRHIRRCYVFSEREDETHLDLMCSNMYREAVYLARRDYFSRDIFLEHIALCGMLGYEEFHRRQWFYKTASWINDDGCIQEDQNFTINLTKIYIEAANNSKKIKDMEKLRQKLLADECHIHPMILLVVVLAHGIRHAAHFMQ